MTNYRKSFFYCIIFQIIFSSQVIAQFKSDFKVKPQPTWIKNYPVPKLKKEYDLDLVLLQEEFQYNDKTEEVFRKYYYYLNTLKGVNQIKLFFFWYEPEFEDIKIHNVNFHRGKKTIILDRKLHIEKEIYEKQIGGTLYANDGKIKIFFEGAEQGDIIEFSYTEKGRQPDLKGSLSLNYSPVNDKLRGISYTRVLNTKPISFHSINWNPKIIYSKFDQLFSAEFKIENDKSVAHFKVPSWYRAKKEIYFF
ncbi:DUF3857 domain-containing protein [Tenacibaculum agarivorans]|uniref:DUF3857 domain-containing protein n=1 Tax=Tenacibaculum agarivorans TaxID=1908389 RepID=UPI00094B7AF8|nr:DUF3857 domain-containing protein [Tenacibaculum agarivorans]